MARDTKTTTELLLVDHPTTIQSSHSTDNTKKPALLVDQGTVQSVVMKARPTPIKKYEKKLKTPRKTQKQRTYTHCCFCKIVKVIVFYSLLFTI